MTTPQTRPAPDMALTVLNNVRWYEAMFAAHGLASETDGRMWRSRATPPPFHSNLVVLSPLTTLTDIEACAADIERQPRPGGWSLKDSYACIDLSASGHRVFFEADWIWRDPDPLPAAPHDSRLSWVPLRTAATLAEWEQAWSGDARNESDLPRHRISRHCRTSRSRR